MFFDDYGDQRLAGSRLNETSRK